jgi:hypothetical protein
MVRGRLSRRREERDGGGHLFVKPGTDPGGARGRSEEEQRTIRGGATRRRARLVNGEKAVRRVSVNPLYEGCVNVYRPANRWIPGKLKR